MAKKKKPARPATYPVKPGTKVSLASLGSWKP